MKLYLVTREDKLGWDEFRGAVIAANSPQAARKIMLNLNRYDEEHQTVQWKSILIAKIAEPRIKEGAVLTSFRNG